MATLQPKLGMVERVGYGIGAMGEGLAFNLVSTFFMVYCTDVLGIAPVWMAVLFFAARLWDAVNDPIMGTISENVRTKWGKHKPWIILGSVTNAAVLVGMFSPGLAHLASPMLAIAVLYVLFDMTYTIIDVPYYAYAASFTNTKERDIISTIPRVFGSLGTIGIPAVTQKAVRFLGAGSQAQGYFRWALAIAAFYAACGVVAALAMKKREIGTREERFTFGEALRTLKNNDQLLIIETVFVLLFIAITMTSSVAVYYFKYVWGNADALTYFMLAVGAGMGAAMLSYNLLVKALPRRKIFILSMAVPIVGYLLMFAISMRTKNVYFLLPAVVLTVGCFGFTGILSSVFLVDTVEYGEWKLGYRSENIIFSLLTFMGKFSGAIAGLITGLGLQIGGYVSTNEMLLAIAGDAERVTAQPQGVGTALNIMMFAVPPVILLAALLLYLKKYKLHGTFLREITQTLEVKRAQ